MSPIRTWKRRGASVAMVAGLGLAAACVPGGPNDISHLSRWSNATFSSEVKNTQVVIASGEDDPAGGGMQKTIEVTVTQSFCDGTTLVQNSLGGSASSFLGYVAPQDGNSSVLGTVPLTGTATATPAGPGCATPSGPGVTTPIAAGAQLLSVVVTGKTGAQISYTRDDGGEYTYQDASATGGVVFSGAVSGLYEFGSSEPAGTWLWQGYWADATGVDVPSLIP